MYTRFIVIGDHGCLDEVRFSVPRTVQVADRQWSHAHQGVDHWVVPVR